jgi:TPR repeat protein
VALDCLALIFRFTFGVQSDLGKAAQLFNKALDAAHVRAMCYYGDLLEEGRSISQDFPQAIWSFCPAANHPAGGYVFDRTPDRPELCRRRPRGDGAPCELLQYGNEDLKPDLERAAIWAEQSAEPGQPSDEEQRIGERGSHKSSK